MPTSFGSYHFFPLSFEVCGAGRSYSTEHTQNNASDFFDAHQENGLWRFNLSGLKILASNIDTWDAFHDAVKGQWLPFLFRLNSKRFEIARDQPGGIGTGDGITTQFQLVKTRSYAYGPANKSVEVVRFPLYGYPQMRVPLGNSTNGPIIYQENEGIFVWLDSTPILTGWTLNREIGLLTFANPPLPGVTVRVQCKFFVLVHGQDLFALQNEGGTYVFSQGAELFQVASET